MLIARSSPECHLYMELHPCTCGETKGPTTHQLVSLDVGLAAVYEGACPRCSSVRRFEFVLDPEMPPADKFGGVTPSRIIDAGEFLMIADKAAKQVPANTDALDPESRQRARWWMARAVNALEEVLKFIPPGGDRVAADALASAAGKEIYLREPGRFRKPRLEAVLAVYRNALSKLSP